MLKKYLLTFKKYSGLIVYLAKNQIALRYRKSYLGMLWSLLNPLLTMLVLNMVFSTLFKHQIENFPIYLMCGRLIYEYNSESTRTAMNSVLSNASLIKKVYIPKYVFPLSSSIAALMNMFFSLIALMIVMIFTHVTPKWTMLLFWLPMAYVFVFSTGLGLILSAINVFFRDIKHLYSVFLTMWLYLTPIFYPIEAIPERVQRIIFLNPLYHYIAMFRGLILYGTLPSLSENIICGLSGLIVLTAGVLLFKKVQDRFILHM